MLPQRENYFFLEPLIVERLESRLVDANGTRLARVMTSIDLAGFERKDRPAPAVDVVLLDDNPVDETKSGASVKVTQTWVCVAVVENFRDARGANPARQDAGALVGAVFSAMQGWEWERLQRFSRAKFSRPIRADGFGRVYYHLAFKTEFVFSV
jgi:hypothetical protein